MKNNNERIPKIAIEQNTISRDWDIRYKGKDNGVKVDDLSFQEKMELLIKYLNNNLNMVKAITGTLSREELENYLNDNLEYLNKNKLPLAIIGC